MCPCKPTEGATAHFCSVIKRKVCQPYSGQSPIRDRHKARACQQQCYIRQVTTASGKLGGNHPRSMGPACSSGVQNRLCAHPSATQSSHNTPVLKGRTGSGETSSDRAHSKGSNTGGSSREKPVCLHPVPRTKEGRSAETGDKLKEVKCLRTHRAFQNGGHTYPPGTAETGRLDGQDRPPGRLLHGSYTRGTQRIPGFLPRRHNVSLQLPPVRPVVCPLGLYQNPKTSNGPSPRDGFPPCCLHRRHSGYGRHSSRSEGTGASPVLPPRKPGVHSQPEKMPINAHPDNRIFGFHAELLDHGAEASWREIQEDPPRSAEAAGSTTGASQRLITPHWENECGNEGNSPCPLVLSDPASRACAGPSPSRSGLQCSPGPDKRGKGGAPVVDRPPPPVEWKSTDQPQTHSDHHDGCIPDGLGGHLSGKQDRRSLVIPGSTGTHQLAGAPGSLSGDKILLERQEECVSAPTVGQHHCSSVHQQPGRDSIPSPDAASTEAVDVVSGARHLLDSSTPAGCTEHSSRLGVSSDERQDRLATESNHFSTDKSKVRSTRSRPLCLQADGTPTKVFQLATGSPGRGDRCISPRLEPYPGVCQPTMVPARPSPGSGAHPTGTSHTDSPSMEDPALVPGPPQHVSLHAPADSEAATGSVPGGTQAKPCGGKATASRVAYLRDRFRDKSLSEQSSALLLASWRTKTSRSYDSLFQKWVSWCSERSTDPISGPVSDVVNFLGDLYAQGYQYRSLNSYRSAISSVHDQVDGCPVGQHPLVSRVLKGVFNSRPPLPRYVGTWDVQVVLTFIEGLGPSRDLSLRDLSLKLAMLLALTRPSRSADLCQLKVTRRRYTPDGVIFAPAELAKQSRPGRVLVNFFFPSFRDNELLCPVHTLRVYEDVTSLFRSDQKPGLFLATIKPHNPVTSSTIARWLRTVMERAGVDTSVFKAHSVRGASTSAAANVGVTTQDILNAADWRTESVFKRFYHRSTGLSTFGTAVLKSKASKDTVDM